MRLDNQGCSVCTYHTCTSITTCCCVCLSQDIPEQRNGSDCGVFTCMVSFNTRVVLVPEAHGTCTLYTSHTRVHQPPTSSLLSALNCLVGYLEGGRREEARLLYCTNWLAMLCCSIISITATVFVCPAHSNDVSW